MAYLQITRRDSKETIIGVYRTFTELNEYLQAYYAKIERVTAWTFKDTNILLTSDFYIEVIYSAFPRYFLQAVTEQEYNEAQAKALENNTDGLAFSCLIQDETSLEDIQNQLKDTSITAASFETYTGDYSPLFIRYGQPSFRQDNANWYKVVWTW